VIDLDPIQVEQYCFGKCLEAKRRMLGMKVVHEGCGRFRVDIMEESVVKHGPLGENEREALYLACRQYFGEWG